MNVENTDLLDEFAVLSGELKKGASVRASYKISQDAAQMLKEMTSKSGTVKDFLVLTVMKFVTGTKGVSKVPIINLAESNASEYFENFDDFYDFLGNEGHLTWDEADSLASYLRTICPTIKELNQAIYAVVSGQGEKVTKTFVISNGLKRFIDRQSNESGLSKSAFVEFLIRVRSINESGIRLERAKKYYGIFNEIHKRLIPPLEELEQQSNCFGNRGLIYEMLKDHHLDRDRDLFYPNLNDGDSTREPIQVAMNYYQYFMKNMYERLGYALDDAVEAEKDILVKHGLDPNDYLPNGDEK